MLRNRNLLLFPWSTTGTTCQNDKIITTVEASVSKRSASQYIDQKSPVSDYAPVATECPSDQQWIRPATNLSQQESTWVRGRKVKVLDSLSPYLQRLNLKSFDVDEYVARLRCHYDNVPTISMAISGGGYASAYTATGALRAFDDRFPDALKTRNGGVLQSMTYMIGLSGGTIPIMSLATHDFPSAQDMVSKWNVNISQPADGASTPLSANETTLFEQIAAKAEAGYEVGVLEFICRIWGYEFVAGPQGGLNTLISAIAELSSFQNHDMPFPMWAAAMARPDDTRYFGIEVPDSDSPVLEFTPFEVGTWEQPAGSPGAFFPTKFMGTEMHAGRPVGDCVIGLDRATYVMAMAADAANFWLIEDEDFHGPADLVRELQSLLSRYLSIPNTTSLYTSFPSPFSGLPSSSSSNHTLFPQNLTVVDASETGQGVPFWPLLQAARRSDLIISWDDDEDAAPFAWNNGTNLYDTYLAATRSGLPFPVIPKPATFINRNYTREPVFFGCEPGLTDSDDSRAPIVLYLTNSPYSTYSNFSWTSPTIYAEQLDAILTNSGNIATLGNGTFDGEWAECLGCAVVERSLERVGMGRTEQCQRCMERYCWDGVEDDRDPGIVDLPLRLDPGLSYEEWNRTVSEAGYWVEVS